ncbi:hypothetical protein FF1_019527 [Malus domestica]
MRPQARGSFQRHGQCLAHGDDLGFVRPFSQLGSSALNHHIVSLTSSIYGLLTLDPPSPVPITPPTPPPRFTLGSIFSSTLSEPKLFWSEPRSLWSEPRPLRSDPEVINSWELMVGLDANSQEINQISVGDVIPDDTLTYFEEEDKVQSVGVHSLTVGKKVILFGVPGAFTPLAV